MATYILIDRQTDKHFVTSGIFKPCQCRLQTEIPQRNHRKILA